MIWSSRWFQSGIKWSTGDAPLLSVRESIRSKVGTMVSSALLDMTACAVGPRYVFMCYNRRPKLIYSSVHIRCIFSEEAKVVSYDFL